MINNNTDEDNNSELILPSSKRMNYETLIDLLRKIKEKNQDDVSKIKTKFRIGKL